VLPIRTGSFETTVKWNQNDERHPMHAE